MGALDQLQEATGRLAATAESADGMISVLLTGTGEVEVRLRPGSLRGRSEEALSTTITRLLGDAMWDLRMQYRTASRNILGLD